VLCPHPKPQVRELELNADMRSVNNLLDFLEKVGTLHPPPVSRSRRAAPKLTGRSARAPHAPPHPSLSPPPTPTLHPPSPQKVFNGGSDFNEPVLRCLSRLTDAKWANSDILLVSGGPAGAEHGGMGSRRHA
jgi:hypothetical protein